MKTREKRKDPQGKTINLRSKLVVLGAGVFLCLLDTHTTAQAAGWVDDWVDQKTVNAPSYFEGQKRGYYNGGGFSARWNLQNDYLMTFTPPKLKSGCGGIDAFMGGFSFLDTEYMVQKLQRIMSAAPAAAFDIALKTLVPQVSETIGRLENAANTLNNIQLDECKASRALVTTIASPFAPSDKQGELAAIQADFRQSTGVDTLWQSVQAGYKSNEGKPDAAIASASLAGCPPQFTSLFGSGSVIANAGAGMGITQASYLNLMRGFIGDIYVEAPSAAPGGATSFKVIYDPPCDNKGAQSILGGTVQSKAAGAACVLAPDANRNLRQYVTIMMNDIADKIKEAPGGGAVFTGPETAFINSSPVAIFQTLKTAVISQQEDVVVAKLSDITANAYAYNMLLDMVSQVEGIAKHARRIAKSQSAAVPGKAPETCQISNVQEAIDMIDFWETWVNDLKKMAYNDYLVSLSELNTIDQFLSNRMVAEQQIRGSLLEKFGNPAMVNRALK